MKKGLIYILLVGVLSLMGFISPTFAADGLSEKIFKIQSYEKNDYSLNYQPYAYGSAVLIKDDKVITNAHVILSEQGEPSGYYELCRTISFKEEPECFTTLTLLHYNEDDDLAVLQINKDIDLGGPVIKSNLDLDLGDSVKIYGYPANGGETITFTEGKISGYTDGFYKVDANMDAGNSGGGAFDADGKLLGISAAVSVGYTTLGLVIPLEKVDKILAKKGDIEVFSGTISSEFQEFIDRRQSILSSKNTIKDKQFTLSNIDDYGFNIYDIRTSLEEDIATYVLDSKDTSDDILIVLQTTRFFGKGLSDILMEKSDSYVAEKLANEGLKVNSKEFNFKGKKANISAVYSLDKSDTEVMLILEIDNISYLILGDKTELDSIKNALLLFLKGMDINDDIELPTIDSLKLGALTADIGSMTIFQVLDIYDIKTNFVPDTKNFYEGNISYEKFEKEYYLEDYDMNGYISYYAGIIDIYNDDIKEVIKAELRENKNGIPYGYLESYTYETGQKKYTYLFFEDKDEQFVVYTIDIIILDGDDLTKEVVATFIDSINVEAESPFENIGALGEVNFDSYYHYDNYDYGLNDDLKSFSVHLSPEDIEAGDDITIEIRALDDEDVVLEDFNGEVKFTLVRHKGEDIEFLSEDDYEWASYDGGSYGFTDTDMGILVLKDELKIFEEGTYSLFVEDYYDEDKYGLVEFTIE